MREEGSQCWSRAVIVAVRERSVDVRREEGPKHRRSALLSIKSNESCLRHWWTTTLVPDPETRFQYLVKGVGGRSRHGRPDAEVNTARRSSRSTKGVSKGANNNGDDDEDDKPDKRKRHSKGPLGSPVKHPAKSRVKRDALVERQSNNGARTGATTAGSSSRRPRSAKA